MISDRHSVYLAWLISTVFFFYQYMLRVMPNIMSKEIFETFKITAEEFSTLGSIGMMTYGLLQIPIGFLLDRINLKKVSLIAILLSISGAILFGFSSEFYLMQISRFILAVGSSAALGIALKIISSNFNGMIRSFLSGLTLTVGVFGPILGAQIVSFVLQWHDWRIAVVIIGLSGFILFLLSIIFIKNFNHEANDRGFKNIISQIKSVFTLPIFLYSVIAGGIYAPVCVFGDLWGVRFLNAKFGLSEADAINISLSALYIGLAVGSLILPYLSEMIGNLNFVIITTLLINAILFCVMIFIEDISIDSLYILVSAIGFFCGSEMICFNAAWNLVPKSCTALTVGVINSLSLVFNAIFQQAVGFLMDMMWDGKTNESGIRIYSEDTYVMGISLIPIILSICFTMSILLIRKINTR